MHPPPLFVVSTGRCGSNLVSEFLRAHPRVLSLNDVLTNTRPYTFAFNPIDGRRLWWMLDRPYLPSVIMARHGLWVEEFLYPRRPGMRFQAEEGIPGILLGTLPHLTEEPDALYDALRAFVLALPEDALGTQLQRVFGWLRERFGKALWIERSGGSLGLVPSILEHFPDARFIHLYRDGRECAMSMSRHHVYRLGFGIPELARAFGFRADSSAGSAGGDPAEMDRLPDQVAFDAEAYRQREVDPALFGELWSGWILEGLDNLARVPPERVFNLCYETLLQSPRPELERLGHFILPGEPRAEWVARCAARVHVKPPSWRALPAPARDRLEARCRPGLERLGYL
jgi:putative sulfotransferase